MADVRQVLQFVEWNVQVENDSAEIISIDRLGNRDTVTELTGEMSTAYRTGFSPFLGQDTYYVDFYTFEFNSLISSYPVSEFKSRWANRGSVHVGLTHSMVLAQHLGVEKLKAIRRYYDHHQVPVGRIRLDAFKRLLEQASILPDDDADIWLCLNPPTGRFHFFRIEYKRCLCGMRQPIGVCCKRLHTKTS